MTKRYRELQNLIRFDVEWMKASKLRNLSEIGLEKSDDVENAKFVG